jgi:fructose-1,6-bisphosphatase I
MNHEFTEHIDRSNPYTLGDHFEAIRSELASEDRVDLEKVVMTISKACKVIHAALKEASLMNLYGYEGGGQENATGDSQKKVDVLSNDVLKKGLLALGKHAIIASEEEHEVILGPDDGKYYIAFDPLDGSSNIECNVTIGTIFGVWRREHMDKPIQASDILLPGKKLIASGYCIYGTSTQLYIALANKVNGFTLDLTIGEFVLTHKNVHIKKHAPIYSINEGNTKKWPAPVKNYIESVKFPSEGTAFSLRYIGSMVADVHRTLLYGGIFIYPQDSSSLEREAALPVRVRSAGPFDRLRRRVRHYGQAADTGSGAH